MNPFDASRFVLAEARLAHELRRHQVATFRVHGLDKSLQVGVGSEPSENLSDRSTRARPHTLAIALLG
jgi:hypothetical protein